MYNNVESSFIHNSQSLVTIRMSNNRRTKKLYTKLYCTIMLRRKICNNINGCLKHQVSKRSQVQKNEYLITLNSYEFERQGKIIKFYFVILFPVSSPLARPDPGFSASNWCPDHKLPSWKSGKKTSVTSPLSGELSTLLSCFHGSFPKCVFCSQILWDFKGLNYTYKPLCLTYSNFKPTLRTRIALEKWESSVYTLKFLHSP